MDDVRLLRYSRQIMLPQLDLAGQERLLQARVLIIGLGGLGSPVAMYLAAGGVGTLVLNDFDTVDLSNLQRQVVHADASVGRLKVDSARERLLELNPDIRVETVPARLSAAELLAQVQTVDLVLDCTDQLDVRLAINRACVQAGRPLVSAAAIRWEGQISVFHPGVPDSPCYQCFYGDVQGLPETCAANGVAGPLLGVMGSMQALEALKLITGAGESLIGQVLLFDGLGMEWTRFRLQRRPDCGCCGR
ncbi:MAG: molybdopterin-synthase adenylyltransferase MoeB [Thiothrix sp.]|nr:molybdopterin-synthase adenylyltransferase MoeB [Thiothrix sp.]HPQ95652.1 molybdopterin-synthase adenylyltransferase MoeB [Thiolinea sp.]